MAFGALLGAGCFVTTYVLARILEDMPETRTIAANAAFFRDVLSFALPVAALPLLHATTGGITVGVAITFIVYYLLLTGARITHACCCMLQLRAVCCVLRAGALA